MILCQINKISRVLGAQFYTCPPKCKICQANTVFEDVSFAVNIWPADSGCKKYWVSCSVTDDTMMSTYTIKLLNNNFRTV